MIRFHEGEITYLEDLDGNEKTVTFASSRFSKFAIVYGEEGAFDGQSGALKVFRSQWNGWQTGFSQYNSKFKPGKETKVTLTFDCDVRSYMDYNNPDWTRVEDQDTGKTFTAVLTPTDDSLTVGIADLNGNSTAKLLNVKVEQEQEKLGTITGTDQSIPLVLSEHNPSFVAGKPVTVTLTFDREVVAGIRYTRRNEDGTAETATETAPAPGKTFTWTITPADSTVEIFVADMKGSTSVSLLEAEVRQAVEPVYIFRHSWGAEGDSYSDTISAHCRETYEVGDRVRITAVFDKSSQAKLMVTSGNTEEAEITATGTKIVLETTPGTDGFTIQAADDSKLPLGLLDVTAEIIEKAEPPEGLHRFMAAWAGFETALSEYNPDFKVGEETTVILTFDKEVKAQGAFKTETSDWDVREGTGKEMTLTVTPKEDYVNIQITDMAGEPAVTLMSVKVEQQKKPEEEALHEFTEAWAGFAQELSKYNPDFQPGLETTVTLTFDKEAHAQGAFKTESSDWDVKAGTGKEIVLTVVPKEDYINIQITDMAGETSINLLAVKVEQAAANNLLMTDLGFIVEEDPIHVFTEPETVILQLTDYSEDYEEGQNVTVDMALISDGPFTVMIGEADLTQGTASDASRRKATPSDAQKDSRARTYESDEDCMAVVQWKGRPKSGAIAVTILEMEGTQVVIDYISAERRETPESSGNTAVKSGSGVHSSASGTGPEKTENAADKEQVNKEDSGIKNPGNESSEEKADIPAGSMAEAGDPGDTGTEAGDSGSTETETEKSENAETKTSDSESAETETEDSESSGTETENLGSPETETGNPENTETETENPESAGTEAEDPGDTREETGEAESSEPETQSPGACTPEEETSEGSGQEDDESETSESESEEDKDAGQESGESGDSGSEDPQSDSRSEEE